MDWNIFLIEDLEKVAGSEGYRIVQMGLTCFGYTTGTHGGCLLHLLMIASGIMASNVPFEQIAVS